MRSTMKLGCIFTVTCLVGCLAGDITEVSTKVTDNGGLTAPKLESIAVKCNEQSYAQVEYPGLDDQEIRQVYVVGDGMSCNPAQNSYEIGPEQVGRVVRVFCPPFQVVNFQRIIK